MQDNKPKWIVGATSLGLLAVTLLAADHRSAQAYQIVSEADASAIAGGACPPTETRHCENGGSIWLPWTFCLGKNYIVNLPGESEEESYRAGGDNVYCGVGGTCVITGKSTTVSCAN